MEEDEDPGGACAASCRGQLPAFCCYIGMSQVSHVRLAQYAREPPCRCSLIFHPALATENLSFIDENKLSSQRFGGRKEETLERTLQP